MITVDGPGQGATESALLPSHTNGEVEVVVPLHGFVELTSKKTVPVDRLHANVTARLPHATELPFHADPPHVIGTVPSGANAPPNVAYSVGASVAFGQRTIPPPPDREPSLVEDTSVSTPQNIDGKLHELLDDELELDDPATKSAQNLSGNVRGLNELLLDDDELDDDPPTKSAQNRSGKRRRRSAQNLSGSVRGPDELTDELLDELTLVGQHSGQYT